MNLNSVTLIGRIGHDLNVRYTQTGTPVVNFDLGVNEFYVVDDVKKSRVDWIPCVTFGKNAEILARYGAKGRCLVIEGSLQSSRWDDNGKTRRSIAVKVGTFQFGDSKLPEAETVAVPAGVADEDAPYDDNDIPF